MFIILPRISVSASEVNFSCDFRYSIAIIFLLAYSMRSDVIVFCDVFLSFSSFFSSFLSSWLVVHLIIFSANSYSLFWYVSLVSPFHLFAGNPSISISLISSFLVPIFVNFIFEPFFVSSLLFSSVSIVIINMKNVKYTIFVFISPILSSTCSIFRYRPLVV